MSRCFPYPPPGYILSQAKNDALIESIKLQKEREKAKEQRKKEKKREKEEKKKEKKEKKKEKKDRTKESKGTTDQKLDKSDIVKSQSQKIWSDAKGEFLLKGREPDTEQLERSSLTEDHGHPVCLRVPTSSSDSTENSNKRKRQSSPVDGTRARGKIIRIRLSSKKQNEAVAPAAYQGPCSTSGRTEFPVETKDNIVSRDRRENIPFTLERTSNVGQAFALKTHKEICTPSRPFQKITPSRTVTPSLPAVMTPIEEEELRYKDLIGNWVPPSLQDESTDPDLDWLFKSRNSNVEKRWASRNDIVPCSSSEVVSCSSGSSLWPRAQYLDGVDIYALPFTVPY